MVATKIYAQIESSFQNEVHTIITVSATIHLEGYENDVWSCRNVLDAVC